MISKRISNSRIQEGLGFVARDDEAKGKRIIKLKL